MQIEEGKFYRTRDGRKVGPMRYNTDPFEKVWPWCGGGLSYTYEGIWAPDFRETSRDLIAEWTDEPEAPDDNFAALAARHGIRITVTDGDVTATYDGRTTSQDT